MRMSIEHAGNEPFTATLPPLGNGELSFQVGPDGTMARTAHAMIPGIRRSGWRWDVGSYSGGWEFFPFGFFSQELPGCGEVVRSKITFDTIRASVETETHLKDGTILFSEVFCHAAENIIAIRKRSSLPIHFRFIHHPPYRRLQMFPLEQGIWNCVYDLAEIREEKFAVLASDSTFSLSCADEEIIYDGSLTECCWILAWGDSAIRMAKDFSFDELFQSHLAEWQKFYARCKKMELPENLQRCYDTALYHMKISSTRWGVPTGLFDSHWYGRFFAFDELFVLRGFLSAGCLEEAKKIAAFRISTYPAAKQRACKDGKGETCLYSWETLEDGSEGGPSGYWLDHIFQNAHVALGIAEYAEASGDLEFLRNGGWDVIRSCALYYEKQMLYECGGKTIIGSCTDLERLGEHRRNAFMTTCSGIALFRCAADVAEKIDAGDGIESHFRLLADRLKAGLPEENGCFVAYPGGPAESIGLLGGFYPYAVLPATDMRACAALDRFISEENRIGNMYNTGKSICTWYRLWKCMALLYAGRRAEVEKEISILVRETGEWGEFFEIYEKSMRPFFTSAEGVFLTVLHCLYSFSVKSY